jgi:hypothetical protein
MTDLSHSGAQGIFDTNTQIKQSEVEDRVSTPNSISTKHLTQGKTSFDFFFDDSKKSSQKQSSSRRVFFEPELLTSEKEVFSEVRTIKTESLSSDIRSQNAIEHSLNSANHNEHQNIDQYVEPTKSVRQPEIRSIATAMLAGK